MNNKPRTPVKAHKSVRRLYAVGAAKKAIQERIAWLQTAIQAVEHDQESWTNIALLPAYQDEKQSLENLLKIFVVFEV